MLPPKFPYKRALIIRLTRGTAHGCSGAKITRPAYGRAFQPMGAALCCGKAVL
ncbi:MAG: hypothetical protein J6K66_07090 [Clostridia bacterium]|nr:hypothetical protein [Clostridia bacterium]